MSYLVPVFGIHTGTIVTIVIIVLLIAGLVALTLYGKKLEKRQQENRKQLEDASQIIKLLVLEKKKVKLKDSGLPQIVIEQTPKRFRGQKVPVIRAKVGPRVTSFMCDEKIFDLVPEKKEVRAKVSGIYIMGVKGIHSSLDAKKRKLTFREKVTGKMNSILSKADK